MDNTEGGPHPGTRSRVPVTALVLPGSREKIDELAYEHRLSRSQVLRIIVQLGLNSPELSASLKRAGGQL